MFWMNDEVVVASFHKEEEARGALEAFKKKPEKFPFKIRQWLLPSRTINRSYSKTNHFNSIQQTLQKNKTNPKEARIKDSNLQTSSTTENSPVPAAPKKVAEENPDPSEAPNLVE